MAAATMIACVTGANKGIGLEILRKLAPQSAVVIMAVRAVELGEAAAAALAEEEDIRNVEVRQLDLVDPESIAAFAQTVEAEHGRLDVLVNNAGFAFKAADPTPHAEQARPTMAVNYFGTVNVLDALLPLVRQSEHGRVVNVSSQAGMLRIMPSEERKARLVAEDLTREELDQMANDFIAEVEAGTYEASGWPSTNYGASKLFLTALTKVIAREEPTLRVNACCPGYCSTDMSSHKGPRSAEMGARTPAWLATLPDDGPTGGFFYDQEELAW